MNINERRRLFNAKLRLGLDQKTVKNGGEYAARYLREAVELAAGPPRLEEPLLEIATYRLAHAMLRVATTPEDYNEIRLLLTAAERQTGYLSLRSRILHLVTLHRMAWFEPLRSRKHSKDAIDRVWEEIILALRRFEQNDVNSSLTKTTALLQSAPFSMVELAGYFTACDLRGFDGVTYRSDYDPEFEGLSNQPAYIVCSSDDKPHDTQQRIPRDIALEMIDQRRDRKMADVVFVIDENGGSAQLPNGDIFAKKKQVLAFGLALGILSYEQIIVPLKNGALTKCIKEINGRLKIEGLGDNCISMDKPKHYSFAPRLSVAGAISRKILNGKILDDDWGVK